jgi:DNA-binding MarR family transcriptional regulator
MDKPPADMQIKALLAHLDTLGENAFGSRRRSDLEISPQETRAVTCLAKREFAIMTDLANDLGIPLSTTTHIVDRLVQKGLATRFRSDEDRRVVQVQLSAEGKKLEQTFLRQRMAIARGMLAPLSSAERETLLDLMAKMTRVSEPAGFRKN